MHHSVLFFFSLQLFFLKPSFLPFLFSIKLLHLSISSVLLISWSIFMAKLFEISDDLLFFDIYLGFPPEFRFRFPSGNLPEIFYIFIMEKVLEDPEFRSVFSIFPERNSGMCSGNRKFSGTRSGNRKISGMRSGNRKIFRKLCYVHRHPHCTSGFYVKLFMP